MASPKTNNTKALSVKSSGAIPKDENKLKAMQKQLHALASTISTRNSYANQMGQSFDGNRDLWSDCGYEQTLTYQNFYDRYTRQDLVKRIVDAYPKATWSITPRIFEDEDRKETEFEKSWLDFTRRTKIYHYLCRADRLACIGQYSVLVLGFDDGGSLESPVKKAGELLYAQPYSQENAKILSFDVDTKSERFGKPEFYSINVGQSAASDISTVAISMPSLTLKVHWSRVIHMVTDPLESDTYGIPMLQAVYNRLCDLEKVVACSSEMYWRGAFPGYAFEAREGTTISEQSMADLETEIEDYINSLSRYLRVQGIDVKALSPQIVSPREQIDSIVTLIAATEGIPKRVLLGTEEAKLAGSQDEVQWNERVAERRTLFATPFVLRPLIEKLIDVGILGSPKDKEFSIVWPQVNTPTELQLATIAQIQSESLAKYSTSGSDIIVPPFHYLTEVLKFSVEKSESILKDALVLQEDRDEEQAQLDEMAKVDEEEKFQRDESAKLNQIAITKDKVV